MTQMLLLRTLTRLLLYASLSLVILCFAITQITGTGSAINDTLNKAGAYDIISKEARTGLASSPLVPAKYQTLYTQSLETAVDSAQIETMIKPAIVDIATWINQPADTPPPDVIVVVKPAKDELIKQMAAGGLGATDQRALQTQLSQQIPDQIRLSSLQDIIGKSAQGDSPATPTTTASTPATPNAADKTAQASILDSLKQVKNVIRGIQIALIVNLIASLVLTALLMFLSRQQGRSWLRGPSILYITVGGGWLIWSFIIPLLFKPAATTLTPESIPGHIIPILVAQFLAGGLWPALAISVLGIIGLIISFLIPAGAPQQPGTLRSLPNKR